MTTETTQQVQIPFRDLYQKLIKTFDLGPLCTELMTHIMAGSEKSDDYEDVLKRDVFFTATICKAADGSLKTSTVKSLGHAVVLIGQQNVRNMVLGHFISRLFSPNADAEFVDFQTCAKKLKYALQAEEQARKIKNEYVGIAFAAGFIFDIFAEKIAKDPRLTEKFTPLLEITWKHSLRAATLAWILATHERVLISFRKIIFSSTLLHDIGKLGLAVYDPENYQKCFEKMLKQREENRLTDDYEVTIEREFFDLTHPEIGSSLVAQTKILGEVATEIDFHHDGTLLKMRNTDAFLGAAITNIADNLSWLSERNPGFQSPEVQSILKSHTSYFPLNSQDILEVFAHARSKQWV